MACRSKGTQSVGFVTTGFTVTKQLATTAGAGDVNNNDHFSGAVIEKYNQTGRFCPNPSGTSESNLSIH